MHRQTRSQEAGTRRSSRVADRLRRRYPLAIEPLEGRALLSTTALVPAGSTWQYLDNGSDQGAGWRARDFDYRVRAANAADDSAYSNAATATTPAAPPSYPTGTYDASGAVGISDSSYPIPANAYFVSPDGSDAGSGTQAAPWRSLAKAVAAAPGGATIVLRGGVYHESVKLAGKRLAFQPYPHEEVWLDGSIVVSDWVADGTAWRHDGWTHHFAPDADARAIDPAYPMAPYRDMAFLDGAPLRQVGSRAELGTGTFYVDVANNRLYVGTDPTGRTVEASAFATGLKVTASDGSMVRGLGFRRYASSYGPEDSGALRIDSTGVVVEGNTFAWNAVSGLTVYGAEATIRGNTVAFNGEAGIGGYEADGMLMESNAIAYNNQEHFAQGWDAGGVKFTKSQGMIWRDNLVEGNISIGLWCDISCLDTIIVNNVVRNNANIGIYYEISARAIIASNLVVGNGGSGIRVGAGSSQVQVYNNTLVRNGRGISVIDDDRTNSDPVNTWDTYDVTVKNNILYAGDDPSTDLLRVLDYSPVPRSAAEMRLTMDYNAYYRPWSSSPSVLVLWSLGSQVAYYESLDAFQSATGQESHGWGVDDVATDPFFVDAAADDYRLWPESVAIARGEPLPADVAAAIGVEAGVPVNLGMLER